MYETMKLYTFSIFSMPPCHMHYLIADTHDPHHQVVTPTKVSCRKPNTYIFSCRGCSSCALTKFEKVMTTVRGDVHLRIPGSGRS